MSKILIIDDEEKLRGLLARIIKLEGYTVIEAGNLKAAHKTYGVQAMNRKIKNKFTFRYHCLPALLQAMSREPLSMNFHNILLVRFSYSSS